MGLLALVVVAVSAPEDVPLPAYELEVVTVNEPVDNPELLFSETSSWGDEDAPKSYTLYVFHPLGTDTRIALGRMARVPTDPHYPRGMYAKSFACEWVRPGELVALSWSAYGPGKGYWGVQGLVVLERTAETWQEVFRSYEDSHYSGGWYAKFRGKFLLVNDEQTGQMLLRREKHHFSGSDTREPLMRPDGSKYSRHTYQPTEWPCELVDGRLAIGNGTTYLDLKDEAFPAREVAHLKTRFWNLNPSEYDAAIDAKLEELRQLNPELANRDEWTGRVILGGEPPYIPDPTHRWMMR